MSFSTDKRIRKLPFWRDEAIGRILAIMDGLCPTCPENKGFNPAVTHDCMKRAGRISASQVYDGECDEGTLQHWLGALQDYLGALTMLANYLGGHYSFWDNHQHYVDGCRQAQALLMEHANDPDWNGWEAVQKDFDAIDRDADFDEVNTKDTNLYILRIGMAYKLADPSDPIYAEMNKIGQDML